MYYNIYYKYLVKSPNLTETGKRIPKNKKITNLTTKIVKFTTIGKTSKITTQLFPKIENVKFTIP